MTYPETLTWMFQQLPMYQRKGKSAFKKDLTNSIQLANHLNHPEKTFKTIHIAGTNGKGSVSHMLASIFQEAGYKTGLYTSPHLKDFRERIRINGQMVSPHFVTNFIQQHQDFLHKQQLSFFEMTVGMAFQYFAQEKVDIAIIETGLGGRLDSTNIISPKLAIITNIGFDHMQFLGDTLPKIAAEKAGIIKSNTPVVIGERNSLTTPVFKEKARQVEAPIFFAEDTSFTQYDCDLKGEYQSHNLQTVLKAVEVVRKLGWKITEPQLISALKNVQQNTGLQGRWQQLGSDPKIICDTGHNKEGLTYVMHQLSQEKYDQLHIVLGVVNDKDLDGVLPLFPKNAHYYFCKANVPRGLDAQILAEAAKKHDLIGKIYRDIPTAYKAAKQAATPDDLIFIGGSTFTVAEVLP